MKTPQALVLYVCMLLAGMFTSPLAAQPQRPNFLVIIADDMGYSDAGCYGSEIATPNLDGLAAGGLRFTQFYNTARCWPTRSALVTGYYPQQIRRDAMPGVDPKKFGGGGVRPTWARLIPERLKPLGYRAYHSGKWHVDGKPLENGFDRSDQISRSPGFFGPDSSFYLTVATADHAIECLQEHASEFADRPFFHYLAFYAPHFPLHALPEDIARYRDRYLEGWDVLREQRHAKQLEMGITTTALSPLETEIGPPYAFPEQIALLGPGEINRPLPWQQLTDEQRRFQATKMAIHAAMIDRMDREIGRVLEQLRSMNAMENTLICFLSDNGASAEIMVRGNGHDPSAPMGSASTYLCLGPGFSSAANTPFRRHKTWVHEGGISTPFIVHWPNGIEAKNELRSSVAHVTDIAPTILDLAGAKPIVEPGGPPLPGRSLKQIFVEEDASPREVWFYHEGNRGLRQGDWKIVHSLGTRPFPWGSSEQAAAEASTPGEWTLYNLSEDRAEQHDLASIQPERVRSMSARWEELRAKLLEDATSEKDLNQQR